MALRHVELAGSRGIAGELSELEHHRGRSFSEARGTVGGMQAPPPQNTPARLLPSVLERGCLHPLHPSRLCRGLRLAQAMLSGGVCAGRLVYAVYDVLGVGHPGEDEVVVV